MLRLKGEHDESMPEEPREDSPSPEADEVLRDHPAFEDGSLPDGEEFDDGIEDDHDGRWGIVARGLVIAGATFVPTFLIIFFGLPYLLGEPPLARTPGKPSSVATARVAPKSGSSWSLSTSVSEALRGGPADRPVVPTPPPPQATSPAPAPSAPPTPPVASTPQAPAAPPVASTLPPPTPTPPTTSTPPVVTTPSPAPPPAAKSPAPAAVDKGSDTLAAPSNEARPREREQAPESMPGAATSGSAQSTETTPSLPPAPSRAAEPERRGTASKSAPEPKPAPAARQAAAATPEPPRAQAEARQAEARKLPGDWTPAAAFADREAAARLASSIERQGYPVEIRQEASSTRPWVVWIGSQPNGGGRRR